MFKGIGQTSARSQHSRIDKPLGGDILASTKFQVSAERGSVWKSMFVYKTKRIKLNRKTMRECRRKLHCTATKQKLICTLVYAATQAVLIIMLQPYRCGKQSSKSRMLPMAYNPMNQALYYLQHCNEYDNA